NAVSAAGYPAKDVVMYPVATASSMYSAADANGVVFMSPFAWYFLPQVAQPAGDAVTYFKYMKQVSPKADPTEPESAVNFAQLVTVWRAAKAIGWQAFDAKSLATYLSTKAAGNLDVFMAGKAARVPGDAAVKQPNVFLWRFQDKKALPLGWWDGY